MIRTKTALLAAMQEHPGMLLRWNITPSSGTRGIYTFNGETVLARAADAVITSPFVHRLKRGASWNSLSWRFLGMD